MPIKIKNITTILYIIFVAQGCCIIEHNNQKDLTSLTLEQLMNIEIHSTPKD